MAVKVNGRNGFALPDPERGVLRIEWSEGILRKRARSTEIPFDDIRRSTPSGTNRRRLFYWVDQAVVKRSTPSGTHLEIGEMELDFPDAGALSALAGALSEYYGRFRAVLGDINGAFVRFVEIYADLSAFRKAASEDPAAAAMRFPAEKARRLGVKRRSATSIERAYLDEVKRACAELSSVTGTVPKALAEDAVRVLNEMSEVLNGLDSGSLSPSSARERAGAIASEIEALWRWPEA